MPVALQISVKPAPRLLKLGKMGERLNVELKKQMFGMGRLLQRKTRKNLRGPILQKRSGKLGRDIKYRVDGEVVNNLKLTVSSDLAYSSLQHEGFPNRPVTARQHANSRFYIEGVGWRRFKKETKTVTFKPHPYLTQTLAENRERLRNFIRAAIRMAKQ